MFKAYSGETVYNKMCYSFPLSKVARRDLDGFKILRIKSAISAAKCPNIALAVTVYIYDSQRKSLYIIQ